MTLKPKLHRVLTLYFELSEELAKTVPGVSFRCSNNACEQHNRAYDRVPFDVCPSCYACPVAFEDGTTVLAYPDMDDFLMEVAEDLGEHDFVYGGFSGIPDNVWVYRHTLEWLKDSACGGFETDRPGVLNLYALPVKSIVKRAFLEDINIEAFIDLFEDKYGKGTISLNFGLIQYFDLA